MPLNAGSMMRQVGTPQRENLQCANQMIGDMPAALLNAAREPFAAQAVIFSLLLSRDDEAVRRGQLERLQSQVELPLFQETLQLAAAAQSLPGTARLPLVDLAIPALKRASPQQYARLRPIVDALVSADGKVDLFEYCLRTVLFSYLDVFFGVKKTAGTHSKTLDAVAGPLAVVLSTLAYVGQSDPAAVDRAFQSAVQTLPGKMAILPKPQCTLQTFDAALTKLADSDPNLKRQILAAVTACIAADGRVTVDEGELLRAIAAVLSCPVPPVAVST